MEMEQKETEKVAEDKNKKPSRATKPWFSWLTWGFGCGVGAGVVATPLYCTRSVPTEEEKQGELLFGRSKRVHRKGANHPPEESGVGAEDEAAGTPTHYVIDRLRLHTVSTHVTFTCYRFLA